MNFIINTLQKWNIKIKLKKIDRLDPHVFNRKSCMYLVNLLITDRFHNYTQHKNLGINIQSMHGDIGEYTKKIISINTTIKRKKILSTDIDNGDYRYMSMDNFITTDGYYVDTELALINFKNAIVMLCKLTAESDISDSGLPEHNKRMLTKTFTNLCQILSIIVNVSIIN